MNSNAVWEMSRTYSGQSDPIQREAQYEKLLQQLGVEPSRFHQELQMTSRFVQTHRDVSYLRRDVALHSHTFFEILCCCSTCGMEYLVGTERYRLQAGDIVIVPPGVSHRPIFPEMLPEPYQRYLLWVSPEFFERSQPLIQGTPLTQGLPSHLLRTAGTRWNYLPELFEQGVLESEGRDDCWEMAVLGNSVTLLTHLIRAIRSGSGRLKAEEPGLVDQVLTYAEAHLAEKITLADVARVFYVSESTISQTFRKKMGVSFYKCVTQRRLIAAKALIRDGVPLEAISSRVGFSDYSSFYRAFRQEFGVSPRDYRAAVIPR